MAKNWNDILNEIKTAQQAGRSAVDVIRRRHLKRLADYTGRNTIAYYSGFLSKPDNRQSGISDEDKNGFMMTIHRMDRSKGLDLILHTQGGDIAATQSLVDYLHDMFGDDIRAIVPQIAMSAGTMIACSSKEIIMAKHSSLGPVDPQVFGMPAAGIIHEFDEAKAAIKADPAEIPLWQAILSRYSPTLLSQARNAVDWADAFVTDQLATVMFATNGDQAAKDSARAKAQFIVNGLTDYTGNKNHARHIGIDESHALGLNVTALENDQQLQDLVLPVHHCYMHTLMNSPAYKIIENQMGLALVKNEAVTQQIQLG